MFLRAPSLISGVPSCLQVSPVALLYHFSLQRLIVFFSMNCGQMEDMILERNISVYVIRFSLFSEGVCVIPVFCGSLHCARRASTALKTELFFECWNSLDCMHRHFIFRAFSGKTLIPDDLYPSDFTRENLHVRAWGIAATTHMH